MCLQHVCMSYVPINQIGYCIKQDPLYQENSLWILLRKYKMSMGSVSMDSGVPQVQTNPCQNMSCVLSKPAWDLPCRLQPSSATGFHPFGFLPLPKLDEGNTAGNTLNSMVKTHENPLFPLQISREPSEQITWPENPQEIQRSIQMSIAEFNGKLLRLKKPQVNHSMEIQWKLAMQLKFPS